MPLKMKVLAVFKLFCPSRTNDWRDHYQFIYRDNGVGLPQKEAPSSGLGTSIIDMMAQQLKGSLNVDSSNGVKYTLLFN